MIKYRLVLPETEEEKKEIEKLISDSMNETDIDPNEFEFFQLEDT